MLTNGKRRNLQVCKSRPEILLQAYKTSVHAG